MRKLTLLNEIFGKFGVVKRFGSKNDRMFGLKSLEENVINISMSASDATDNLGDELESTFFGGIIRQIEIGVSLDDTDGV